MRSRIARCVSLVFENEDRVIHVLLTVVAGAYKLSGILLRDEFGKSCLPEIIGGATLSK